MSKLQTAAATAVAVATLAGAGTTEVTAAEKALQPDWHAALKVPGTKTNAPQGVLTKEMIETIQALDSVRLGKTNLTQGAHGPHVKVLQEAIVKWAQEKHVKLPEKFGPDSDWRERTEKALKIFLLKEGGGYSENGIIFSHKAFAALEPWIDPRYTGQMRFTELASALRDIRMGKPDAQLHIGDKGPAAKAINDLLHIIDPKYPANKGIIDGGTEAAVFAARGKTRSEYGYNPGLVIGAETARTLLEKAVAAPHPPPAPTKH